MLVFRESKGGGGPSELKWHKIGQSWELAFYIIDYLQVFNERKKLESKFKSLFFKAVSSVDPNSYADRML